MWIQINEVLPSKIIVGDVLYNLNTNSRYKVLSLNNYYSSNGYYGEVLCVCMDMKEEVVLKFYGFKPPQDLIILRKVGVEDDN